MTEREKALEEVATMLDRFVAAEKAKADKTEGDFYYIRAETFEVRLLASPQATAERFCRMEVGER
jgi:hypothetical protein